MIAEPAATGVTVTVPLDSVAVATAELEVEQTTAPEALESVTVPGVPTVRLSVDGVPLITVDAGCQPAQSVSTTCAGMVSSSFWLMPEVPSCCGMPAQ